jgi:hypothetical protein
MKRFTMIVLVAVTAIGLVATAAFLIPRVVHAGPPVSVNPTVLRIPWQATCEPAPTSGTSALADCTITTVPSTEELVLTDISYLGYTPDASTPEYVYITTTSAGHASTSPWYASGTSSSILINGEFRFHVSNSVETYVDPGTSIVCGVNVSSHADFKNQTCYLYGYYNANE